MRSPERASRSSTISLPQPDDSNPTMSSASCVANETKHIADRLQAALVKVKRLNRLEAALVDFFAEVMDRTGAEWGTPNNGGITEHEASYRRNIWKENLLKKAEGDPLSLLNALRTHLRVQFATQDQHQRQTAQSISALASRNELREQDARAEIQQLDVTNSSLREQVAALAQQVVTSENEKKELIELHQSLMNKARMQLGQVLEHGRRHEENADQLQKQIIALKDINAQQSAQLQLLSIQQDMKIASPTSQLQPAPSVTLARTSSAIDLMGNTPGENQKLRRALRDYESKLEKSEASREELKNEVQRLHKQIVGYRQSTQTQNFVRLEKEEKKLKESVSEFKKRAMESEAELLRTRGTVKEREALIERMKEEYTKLFGVLQKHKTTPSVIPSSPSKLSRVASCSSFGVVSANSGNLTRASDTQTQENVVASSGKSKCNALAANDNPYLLNLYRSKIAELEKQVEGLQVQIRKMIASEYRHKQQNRLFRVEKKHLVNTCDQLRSDFEKAVLVSAKTMTTTKVLAASDAVEIDNELSLLTSSSKTRRPSSSGVLNEIKRLRQRNQFLEERFRAVLQTAGRSSRAANDSGDQEVPDIEATTSSQAGNSNSSIAELENSNVGSFSVSGVSEECEQKTEKSLRRRGSHAQTIESIIPSIEPFASIDADTIQSLQNVKRTARVRPQSAVVARR